MADIKERLAQRIAAASEQVLAKTAGCCSEESAKCPTELIGDAADVQVENNLPAGVTVPGEEGMSASGLTPEDKGTDIGHVETNGPGVPENTEVADIIASAKEFEKKASELIAFAKQILETPDSAFAGVAKQASAEVTEEDVQQFIVKRADAGDPVARGIIEYVNMLNKIAAGEDADAVVEGAGLEAGMAQVQEQVAAALLQEHPELTEEEAQEIAAQATAAAAQDAMGGGEEADPEAIADELVIETAAQIKEQVPGISDEEASVLAVKAVADAFEGGDLGKEASAEEEPKKEDVSQQAMDDKVVKTPAMPDEVEKKASAEDEVKEVADAAEEAPAAAEEAVVAEDAAAADEAVAEGAAEEAAVDEAAVSEQVGQLVMALAEEIKAQDPSISDEEAINAAADEVIDAVETAGVQQEVGAVDEAGAPVVDDATAQGMVDELTKSASAHPLRDALTPAVNNILGLSPEAFAARLNVK